MVDGLGQKAQTYLKKYWSNNMQTHYEKRFLKELSESCNRDVDLSEQSYYSGEQRLHYKRLVVDGKETMHHVDLMALQDTGVRGRMLEEVRNLTRALMLN